ncbi:MAG: rhodanese-like domain-containing protein [Gammaproteobacteria bacterium]
MNKPVTTLAVVLLALASPILFAQQADGSKAPATKAPAFKAHVLTTSELDALLAKPADLLLIDVRRPDEVTSVGGFPVYLSIQLSELEKSLAWIPKGRTIVTVSNHAARAGKAADLLASKGFKVAGAVGADTYEKDGGKITHLKPPAPKT